MLRRLEKLEWGLLIAALLPLMVALPTWGEGIAAGADVEVHVHRIQAMSLALQDGTLYPRWITYLHMGYGYPIFNFYAPLSAYITALFELTGLHITVAYNLVQTLAWSLGSVGMYLLTRRFFSAPVAVLAAALWAFAPSRLYEVWWQGSIAQILAASFIPYLLLGVVRSSIAPTYRTVLAIGIPYAALIMTHTPMMYISTLYAAPLAFFAPMFYTEGERHSQHKWQEIFYRWLMIFGGFALGIGLAAIFLFPTLLELQYVDISNGIDETVNYLQEQFLPPTEIFALPRLIDQTDMYLDFPRTLGLIGGLLSVLGIVALVRKKRFGLLALLVTGLSVTVFMLLASSFDVWMTIPAFANLRFPARLLRIGAVLIAMLGGASLLLLPERYHIAGMIAGVLVVFAQVVPINKPYDVWLTWDDISAYDELVHEYEDRTWGTVSYDEFNPIWGETVYFDMPHNPETYRDDPFQIRIFERDTDGLEITYLDNHIVQVETTDARTVRFRQYYFPGWEVRLNGEIVDSYPDDLLGLISVDLPAGESTIELNYVGTATQFLSSMVSILCALVALGMYRLGMPDTPKTPADTSAPIGVMTGLVCIVGIIAMGVFNARVIQANNWYKFASPPTDPFYMRTPLDATFGTDEPIRLLGYSLHDTRINATGTLDIDLYWHVPESITGNYRPIVQLVNLTQSEAWATSSRLQPAAGETSTFLPERFARDPYRLRLFNDDIPAYVGQLSVQMISSEDGALPLADGSDRLILPDIVRINTDNADFMTMANPVVFGDVAELACVSIEANDTDYDLRLGWDFIGTTDHELVVMVHGLDSEGNVIANGDGAPFDGNYPSQLWQRGQRLLEQRTLITEAPIEAIAIALYTRDSLERLPATQADMSLANNQYVITLDTQTCER